MTCFLAIKRRISTLFKKRKPLKAPSSHGIHDFPVRNTSEEVIDFSKLDVESSQTNSNIKSSELSEYFAGKSSSFLKSAPYSPTATPSGTYYM